MSFARLLNTSTRSFTTRTTAFVGQIKCRKNKDFGWNKLVTPWTSPSFIARMKELDSKFSSMQAEIVSAPKRIDPIEWSHWESVIDDKQAVAAIRKEYESLTFEQAKGEDLTAINANLDFAIEKASKAASISEKLLPELRQKLQQAIDEKVQVHNWQMADYFRRYPGLEEQCRREYMNGEYLTSDAEDRLEAQDINEARKAFRAGGEIPLPSDLPDALGNFSSKAEAAKTDALLESMFGDSKLYQEFKANEAKKSASKVVAGAHH